jgi:FdhE protein
VSRVLCPNCGEEDRDKLPVYTVPEFPHIRVEACDTCRHYVKAVDMTRDGNAVPEVDEIAALPLDLWAMQQGYQKLALNLFD